MINLARLPGALEGDGAVALRNLMGLLALPALWVGRGEQAILQLLVDAVASVVPVAVVFAQVQLPPSHLMASLLKVGKNPLDEQIPLQWQAFTGLCTSQTSRSVVIESPIGVLRAVRFYLGSGINGESIWFGSKDSAFPSVGETGFLHAAVSICTTGLITARIDYDRVKANRRKDEFLAMLGHELRNPLAPLVTTLELIRLKGSGHLAKEHAVMERQVGHLSRLLDDLLDVTRITSNRVDLRAEVFDVRGALIDAVESVSLIQEKQHRITLDTDHLNGLVKGDRERIRQVFANLLVNAAKYTQPGGRIAVTAVQDSKTVSVSIQDNGSGIEADLLPRIFDMFEQGATTVDRAVGGLGVGLAIVKKLVDLHEGVVTAHSEGLGHGARFTVRLPLFEPVASVIPGPPVQSDRAARADVRRVLLVDDNLDALDTLETLLTLYGFEVMIAKDPTQALERAPGFEPTTLVIDIGLPEMDGYQLAAELRRQGGEKIQAAQFIALSGYGQEADKARSLAAGFHRHLVKPVEIDALLEAIRSPARSAAA